MVAIHSFFRYVQKQSPEYLYEFQKILNIPNKKCARTIVPFLTGEEMKILLSQPDPSTAEGRRDLVLLVVLYDTAVRVQELIDLKVKDIRLSNTPPFLHFMEREIKHGRYQSPEKQEPS